MHTDQPASVGAVTPQVFCHHAPFHLVCGRALEGFDLIYETYGTLSPRRDNAVLVCHALSGSHHAAGHYDHEPASAGWWDNMIGPGKPLDTDRFFVVCCNNLGGCAGSTGPSTLCPQTGKPYGADFPMVTVKDWVRSQALLADALSIKVWAAVMGGSLGGMQALQWAVDYPSRMRHVVAIATGARLSAQAIAFNEVARRAIRSDPEFHGGRYGDHDTSPRQGLMLARMLGHVTYLSEADMERRFGRVLRDDEPRYHYDVDFAVESYLRHQGEKFANRFDANTYLLMTKVLDYFDLAKAHDNSVAQALSATQARFLLISFSSDWRFPPAQSRFIMSELLKARRKVSYLNIPSTQGHDSFLLPIVAYHRGVGAFFRSQVGRVVPD